MLYLSFLLLWYLFIKFKILLFDIIYYEYVWYGLLFGLVIISVLLFKGLYLLCKKLLVNLYNLFGLFNFGVKVNLWLIVNK